MPGNRIKSKTGTLTRSAKRPTTRQRDVQILVRLSAREARAWRRLARRHDLGASTLARIGLVLVGDGHADALLDEIRRRRGEDGRTAGKVVAQVVDDVLAGR